MRKKFKIINFVKPKFHFGNIKIILRFVNMIREIHLQTPSSSIWTVDNFIDQDRSDLYYNYFSSDKCPLEVDPTIVIFGKECHCHRRVGFFSDSAAEYPFAGQTALALPSTSRTRNLTKKVNKYLNANFNGALINDYRSGHDYIGSHADNEGTLSCGIVAGISFGTERIFRIRYKTGVNKNKIAIDIKTKHGQLLVMDGNFLKVQTRNPPFVKNRRWAGIDNISCTR